MEVLFALYEAVLGLHYWLMSQVLCAFAWLEIKLGKSQKIYILSV